VKSDLISIKEYSFDAWGRRRSADDWNYTLDTADQPLFAGRGFTGHEHLPEFGLINMNGRLYDPLLGRFLSPDNYVQMPDFSQNFNRYSYALNLTTFKGEGVSLSLSLDNYYQALLYRSVKIQDLAGSGYSLEFGVTFLGYSLGNNVYICPRRIEFLLCFTNIPLSYYKC